MPVPLAGTPLSAVIRDQHPLAAGLSGLCHRGEKMLFTDSEPDEDQRAEAVLERVR